ncbi:glycosyltransferase family 4 protein [candidate division KSB1 bacterium]|nr:glycosyltransferase family 4 protein [candidate division KSB1 bacterium]
MKIVYLNYLYDLYGASLGSTRKAELLMHELAQYGHDVKLYWMKKQPEPSNGQPPKLKQKVRGSLKKYLAVLLHNPKNIMSNFGYFFRELKILRDENPDLVIYRLSNYQFSALWVAKMLKIPVIIEADAPNMYEEKIYETQYWQPPWIGTFIETQVIKHSEMGICVSNVAMDYFRNNGVPDEKICVISNGAYPEKYDAARIENDIRAKFNFKDKVCIGFVGTFHFWHGVENLFKIIREIATEFPNVVFLMVGDGGPLKPAFTKFVQEENLENNVIFSGYVPFEKVAKYLVAMDIVLAPYPNVEMFYYSPVKLFEYMAAGKPVIASALGQIAEMIEDGVSGKLCSPGNVEQMIASIKELIREPELRKKIGDNARQTILKHHTWQIKAQEWSQICHDVVDNYGKN